MASFERRAITRAPWTPDAVQRATAALATIVSTPSATPLDDEARALASQLARCLRYAADAEPEDLVDVLARFEPPCESPRWDELHGWLLRDVTNADLATQLTGCYGDPVPYLIALLNEFAPRGIEWDQFDDGYASRVHRRAYRLLFEIGTKESLRWVLSRLYLFDYESEGDFEEPIQRHNVAIQTLALELWPANTWHRRADIVLLLYTHKLLDHRFIELMTSVDIEMLPPSHRSGYLEALGNCFDRRLLPRIHSVLEREMDGMSRRITAEGKRTVASAAWQYEKLDTEPPAGTRERLTSLGFHWGEGCFPWMQRTHLTQG